MNNLTGVIKELRARSEQYEQAADTLTRLFGASEPNSKPKRVMSAAGRARISAAQKARWAAKRKTNGKGKKAA